MAQIDQLINFLMKNQGERFVVPSGRPCVLQRPSGPMPTAHTLTAPQIQTIVREIAPRPDATDFAYDSPMGKFRILVEGADGNLQLTISPAGSEPAPARVAPPIPGDASRGRPVGHMDELFRLIKDQNGSDIHICCNEKPVFRVHGVLTRQEQYEVQTHEQLKPLLWAIMPERNRGEWEETNDTDFAYEIPGVARYRCNILTDRFGIAGVFRLIPSEVLSVEQLGIAGEKFLDLCWLTKGLVVVTGPTGSGKSTTLAGMIDYVNKNRNEHVLTIEDPIEFVHRNIKCLINQRQVHEHTDSFAKALRAALREDPDIILVGEMRDLETVELAIHAAETGHLVFGTLHTTSAPSTVDRIIDQFPPEQQEQIRVMLSEALKGVIAQTLCRTVDGKRVAAHEVLLVDSACANIIREGKTFQLISMMQVGKQRGCKTMTESLVNFAKAGRIDAKEAYIKALDKIGIKQAFEAEGIKFDAAAIATE